MPFIIPPTMMAFHLLFFVIYPKLVTSADIVFFSPYEFKYFEVQTYCVDNDISTAYHCLFQTIDNWPMLLLMERLSLTGFGWLPNLANAWVNNNSALTFLLVGKKCFHIIFMRMGGVLL